MHKRNSRKRRKRKGDWKYIWRNYVWKPSKSKGNISRYKKHRGLWTIWTQIGPHQGIIKMAKVKERILRAAREMQSVNYKGTPIRLSADFSTETLQARREWQIHSVLKGKNLQPTIIKPAKLSLKIEGEIKNFSNKQKLK